MGRSEHTFGKNDTHCTPPEVFEPVLEALRLDRFGFDPFGNPNSDLPTERRVLLPDYMPFDDELDELKGWAFDPDDPADGETFYGDAYDFDWSGMGAVFCNGPTSKCGRWAEKTHGEDGGDEVVNLWPVRTGALWWQRFVAPSDVILFWRGRVTYKGSKDQAPWHNALAYIGPRGDLFYEGMKKYGWAVRNRRKWT
jgi:hypothetical protein